jgi:hypothetical protein
VGGFVAGDTVGRLVGDNVGCLVGGDDDGSLVGGFVGRYGEVLVSALSTSSGRG